MCSSSYGGPTSKLSHSCIHRQSGSRRRVSMRRLSRHSHTYTTHVGIVTDANVHDTCIMLHNILLHTMPIHTMRVRVFVVFAIHIAAYARHTAQKRICIQASINMIVTDGFDCLVYGGEGDGGHHHQTPTASRHARRGTDRPTKTTRCTDARALL